MTCGLISIEHIWNMTGSVKWRRTLTSSDKAVMVTSDENVLCPSLSLSSGVIRTALPNMDRETRDQYVLVIQAKDMVGQMGGLSGTTSVTVTLTDVNDNPPRFPHSKITLLIVPTGSIKLKATYSTCRVFNSYSTIRIKPPVPCLICSTFFIFFIFWGSSWKGSLKSCYCWKTTWTQRMKGGHFLHCMQWMQWYKKAGLLFHQWKEIIGKYKICNNTYI